MPAPFVVGVLVTLLLLAAVWSARQVVLNFRVDRDRQ